MSENPASLQLRYMQTLLELGASQASTIVFPLPIDLLKPLLDASPGSGSSTGAPAPRPPRAEADDPSERTLEAANGAREIAHGEGGFETREEIEAEVEAELEDQARRVQAEVDRVQAEIAEKRKT